MKFTCNVIFDYLFHSLTKRKCTDPRIPARHSRLRRSPICRFRSIRTLPFLSFVQRSAVVYPVWGAVRRRPALFQLRTQVAVHGMPVRPHSTLVEPARVRRYGSASPARQTAVNQFDEKFIRLSILYLQY